MFWTIYIVGLIVIFFGTALSERYDPGSMTEIDPATDFGLCLSVAAWPLTILCIVGLVVLLVSVSVIVYPWRLIAYGKGVRFWCFNNE
jgi:hypothetical protein